MKYFKNSNKINIFNNEQTSVQLFQNFQSHLAIVTSAMQNVGHSSNKVSFVILNH